MNLDAKKYLTIVLIDHAHNDTNLFKSLSSINNQIGFSLKNNVCINLVTDRDTNYNLINNYNFSNLDVIINKVKNNDYCKLLNDVINSNNYDWITFMDSKDLFFADGSLLDFVNFSKTSEDKHDMFIFKYISSLKNESNGNLEFQSNQFINVIFGKYFNVGFLQKYKILFNKRLDYYLFDDFASKAIKLCNNAIWYDLINYYLTQRRQLKEPAIEFIEYRVDFIKFIKSNTNDNIFDDISWSIVQAFSIIKNQNLFNDTYKNKLKLLYELAFPYDNYNELLENNFKSQLGSEKYFYEFNKFLGV